TRLRRGGVDQRLRASDEGAHLYPPRLSRCMREGDWTTSVTPTPEWSIPDLARRTTHMKKTTRRLAAFMGVAALVTGATATWAAASPTTTTANGTRVALSPGSGRSIVDWNQELAWELGFRPSDRPTQDGIGVGHRVATLMLAARAGDGSAATPPPFVLPDPAPGNYQTTPPNHPTPVFTNWGTVAPFVVSIND